MFGHARLPVAFGAMIVATLGPGLGPANAQASSVAIGQTWAHDLADIDPIEEAPAAIERRPRHRPSRYVTLTIGGDLGFGGGRQPVSPTAGIRQGKRYAYAALTRHIRPLLKSDLAFANLESVVTTNNGLSAMDKAFNFRMHPNGVAHLVKAGINVLSSANNHAIDYGTTGMRHTVKHLAALKSEGLLAAHGVGATSREVFEPARFAVKGASFAFMAMGIGGRPPTASVPGQAHYRSAETFGRITSTVGKENADYRMLSVHYGEELQVRPNADAQRRLAGQAVRERGIDLVMGHHAHTPAGVQRIGDRLVFYGLGNLLHLGMQDMAKFGICRDFGVMARLHLVSDDADGGRLVAHAVELFALADMHVGSRVRRGDAGRQRIEVINYLGDELTDRAAGFEGVRFAVRPDGSGLYCTPAASRLGGALATLCKGWQAPPAPDAASRRLLKRACRYLRKGMALVAGPKPRGAIITAKRKKKGTSGFARAAFQSSK